MNKEQMQALLGGGWTGADAGGGARRYFKAGKGEVKWTHAEIKNGFKGISFLAVGEILSYEPGVRLAAAPPFQPDGLYPVDALTHGDDVSFVVKLGTTSANSRIASWALAIAQTLDPGIAPEAVDSAYVADLLDTGRFEGVVTRYECWEQANKEGTNRYTRETFAPGRVTSPAKAPALDLRAEALAKFPEFSEAIQSLPEAQLKQLLSK